jgi:Predicted Zn peptidase
MTPDFQIAATKAYETILTHGINSAPVDALPIIRSIPNAFVVTFTEMAYGIGIRRDTLLTTFGDQCQDAVTSVRRCGNELYYIVAYNQRMPYYMLQRAFARELGHIVLGHDGSRPEDVRHAEAQLFAMHLLCPRPMIKAIENTGVQITVEMLGTMTGCYGRCLALMRKAEGVRVPSELNRAVREKFADYVENFLCYHQATQYDDESPVANFGSFMDGYEE